MFHVEHLWKTRHPRRRGGAGQGFRNHQLCSTWNICQTPASLTTCFQIVPYGTFHNFNLCLPANRSPSIKVARNVPLGTQRTTEQTLGVWNSTEMFHMEHLKTLCPLGLDWKSCRNFGNKAYFEEDEPMSFLHWNAALHCRFSRSILPASLGFSKRKHYGTCDCGS